MKKVNKIKESDLKLIIEQQSTLNNLNQQIGDIEYKKSLLVNELKELHVGIFDYKEVLESEYGSININLQDGSYVKIEKDVEDKKN